MKALLEAARGVIAAYDNNEPTSPAQSSPHSHREALSIHRLRRLLAEADFDRGIALDRLDQAEKQPGVTIWLVPPKADLSLDVRGDVRKLVGISLTNDLPTGAAPISATLGLHGEPATATAPPTWRIVITLAPGQEPTTHRERIAALAKRKGRCPLIVHGAGVIRVLPTGRRDLWIVLLTYELIRELRAERRDPIFSPLAIRLRPPVAL